ncbi:TrbC/VirB2 family protein [Tianweitania sp. Rool2]|uniref:TrbC/VirB2 family protein n=2 Tax=Oryzicola mucosus TaxID=2767425 RepID=A0A8J6PNK6_9HYPH|nr:TrbC/VirB2 family protein [Oryzicola mucosus]
MLATIPVGLSDFALASSGGSLPWESPLEQIQESITGPVAGFIALAAVAIAGAMLIFGGELNDFARRLCYVALVGGVLLGATQIVALFGATGASIGQIPTQAEQMVWFQSTIISWARESAHG